VRFLVCVFASQYPRGVAGLVLVDHTSDWHDLTPRQAFHAARGIQLSRVGAGLARVGVVRASLCPPHRRRAWRAAEISCASSARRLARTLERLVAKSGSCRGGASGRRDAVVAAEVLPRDGAGTSRLMQTWRMSSAGALAALPDVAARRHLERQSAAGHARQTASG
jgi:hypothetical protein